MAPPRVRPSIRSVAAAPTRIPSLDGLRGIAVAAVVLFHLGYLPGGLLGVDLFFVLSGCLITGLLLHEVQATSRLSLMAFWGRRIRRLFPAVAVVLALTAGAVWLLARSEYAQVDHGMASTTAADGLWAQLNLANWHLLAENASYWEALGQRRVFEHLWSIAVEEQFYLVWPLVIAAAAWGVARIRPRTRRADEAVLAIALALAAASVLVMAALVDAVDTTRVYVGTDTRAFSLLLGAAAATAPARAMFDRAVAALRRSIGGVIGALAAGIGVVWALTDGPQSAWLFPGGLVAHAGACAALIGLCAAVTRAGSAVRVFDHRALTWLGGVSYSLYLWHWPVIVLLPRTTGPGGHLAHAAAAIALSVGLAAATKRLVEDPIRWRARWARTRFGVIALIVASIALVAVWALLPISSAPAIDISDL